MATPSPSFWDAPQLRPLLLQGVVLVLLLLLHLITAFDRWLLALLGSGLLLAVELLALPLPPKGKYRWLRQLGWFAAVLLVAGVSFQIYLLPHATALQRLGMGTLLFYWWMWSAQVFPSTQKRAGLAVVLALSLTALIVLVDGYRHGSSALMPWVWVATVGSSVSCLALLVGRGTPAVPQGLWWRWPQALHLFLLMVAVWAEAYWSPSTSFLWQ